MNKGQDLIAQFLYSVACAHLSTTRRNLTDDEITAIIRKCSTVCRVQLDTPEHRQLWMQAYQLACRDLDIPPWM